MAVALLALFSFSLMEPALLASDPESRLPACCRRLGKHHCEMAAESQEGPSIQASQCGFFPQAVVKSLPLAGLLKTAQVASVSMLSVQARRPPSDTPCQVSYRSTCQKRGPPSLILS